MVAPKSPSSFILSTKSVGYSLACSYLLATGITSRSTNRRTVSTSSAVSSACSDWAVWTDMVLKIHHVWVGHSTATGSAHQRQQARSHGPQGGRRGERAGSGDQPRRRPPAAGSGRGAAGRLGVHRLVVVRLGNGCRNRRWCRRHGWVGRPRRGDGGARDVRGSDRRRRRRRRRSGGLGRR